MRERHLGDFLDPFEGHFVEFLRSVEERGMSAAFPHVELHVLEVTEHEFLQLITENMLVQRSLQDEERKFVLDGEKRTFVLSSRESEKADLRVLPRGASDPSVLGQLRHLVWVCDARLDERFRGLTPLLEVVREQARDEVDNPGVGDLSVHAPPREPSGDDDAGDSVRAVVTQNICGNNGWFEIHQHREISSGQGGASVVERARYLQCSCCGKIGIRTR